MNTFDKIDLGSKMSYKSIDILQKSLAATIFSNKQDAKKAAGRALGTIVEIITYYLLREWGFATNVAIETRLPEFGNPEITHNVEFTLHRTIREELRNRYSPLTFHKARQLFGYIPSEKKSGSVIDGKDVVKNASILGKKEDSSGLCNVDEKSIVFSEIVSVPCAMFECKRVGVEEGQKKGPQTIEKAKQGAYVALKSSSLQKVRDRDGRVFGVYFEDGIIYAEPYESALRSCLRSGSREDFILTFGIVSNHGNWFTSNEMNKEMKVLAQSYDRLLFLTDEGLYTFIDRTILNPPPENLSIRKAFIDSYSSGKKTNKFTKSKISLDAHLTLIRFFKDNIEEVENWFNIISPAETSIGEIKEQLRTLLKN